jgi:RND family efflux transporter MFP subunit
MKKYIFSLMAVLAIFSGCNDRSRHYEEDADHAAESHAHKEGVIEISPERQAFLGISTSPVQAGDFGGVIRASGRILSASGDEMTVVAPVEGTVSLGSLTEGSPVGKGARIAAISSGSLGTGDPLAKAKATYDAARKEYERDLQLRNDNIVSESHLDQSLLEYERARADYEALAAKGVSPSGINVSSPLAGFIKSLMVSNGDFVQTGTPIATVSRNRRIRLRADVPEKYFGQINTVTDAVFTTSYSDRAYGVKELGGSMVGYGRSSEGDGFIPITFEFDNKGDVVPGSYVEVCLKTSAPVKGIHIPLEAVVEDQGVHYAFVKDDDDDDAFLRREIRLGLSDGREVMVVSGLEEGEQVVTKGAVHVKLAGVSAVPAGHSHNH